MSGFFHIGIDVERAAIDFVSKRVRGMYGDVDVKAAVNLTRRTVEGKVCLPKLTSNGTVKFSLIRVADVNVRAALANSQRLLNRIDRDGERADLFASAVSDATRQVFGATPSIEFLPVCIGTSAVRVKLHHLSDQVICSAVFDCRDSQFTTTVDEHVVKMIDMLKRKKA